MFVQSERDGRSVGTLDLRLDSTRQACKWSMLAPDRAVNTDSGTVVFEPHELGMLTIHFKDSREIDELIDVLDKFRKQVCHGIGHWE